MQTTYFVSHAGQTYGPWTIVEITTRIGKMELIATDYIYEDSGGKWIPLMECKAVVEALRSQKPAAAPPTAPPQVKTQAKKPELDLVAQTATITPVEVETDEVSTAG